MDTETLERGPSEQISIRVSPRLRGWLEELAEREDRSLSNVIKRILAQAVGNQKAAARRRYSKPRAASE